MVRIERELVWVDTEEPVEPHIVGLEVNIAVPVSVVDTGVRRVSDTGELDRWGPESLLAGRSPRVAHNIGGAASSVCTEH